MSAGHSVVLFVILLALTLLHIFFFLKHELLEETIGLHSTAIMIICSNVLSSAALS